MPHLTPLSWAAWVVAIAFQPALVVLMYARRVWRRWLSLFTFLIVKSVGSFALLAIYLGIHDPFRQAAVYFYTYWLFAFASALVQIWMIIQIGCEMAGVSRRVRYWIAQGICCCAAIDLGITLVVAFQMTNPLWGRIAHIVLSLNKAVNLAWLVTFMTAVLAYEFLGIRGFDSVRGISIGFAIEAVGATAASWLFGAVRNVSAVSDAQEIIYIVALVVWTVAITPPIQEIASPDDSGRFQLLLRSYVDAIQRITRSRI